MSGPRRIAVLGSTGSIGTQVLDVAGRVPERLEVVALAADRNHRLLAEQANALGVCDVCIGDHPGAAEALRDAMRVPGAVVRVGVDGMCRMVEAEGIDLVVVAVSGAVGIRPTHAAIRAGKAIALASKEVLVAAGQPTMELARQMGVPVLPIDSEHSALFQCLQASRGSDVDRLILTASGGPFRTARLEDLDAVTPERALKHPTWSMGSLVTINSATLMNKGLEIIEAQWLFDVPVDRIDVVVHPQSIVHSLVQFTDGSLLGQLGVPDMRLPIQYALLYPDRPATGLPAADLGAVGTLTFEHPDETKFPALRLARRAAQEGGTMPAVMNAANEAGVALFLDRKLGFVGITDAVAAAMDAHRPEAPEYDAVLKADAWARSFVARRFGGNRVQ